MRIKFSAGQTNLYQRSQVILRYLSFLICVTTSCKLCVFKKDKNVEENYLCFSMQGSKCNVSLPRQHILHTSFFCIITIELFWPATLCHLTFVTLTLTFDFCLKLQVVTDIVCLCPTLGQVVFLYVIMIFLTLGYAISFCWVSIRYLSFSPGQQMLFVSDTRNW